MSEREEQLQKEVTVDSDFGAEEGPEEDSLSDGFGTDSSVLDDTTAKAPVASEDTAESGGLARSIYDRTLGSVLSARALGIAVVTTLVSLFVFGLIPLLGTVGELIGIFVAGLLYGLATDNRRYLELVLAGALAGGGSALLGNLLISVFGTAMPVLAIAGAGAVVAAIGHYVGRDTRAGLTRDID